MEPATEVGAQSQPSMSLGGRLFNALFGPGEVFANVASSPFRVSNWLCPAVLVGVVTAVCALILFSRPEHVQQMMDLQDKELQKAVQQGRMKEKDAEQARTVIQGGLGMAIIKGAAVVGSIGGAIASPLIWALIAWAVSRIVFKSGVGYWRIVEVAGLASVVGAIAAIVSLFLQLGVGGLFTAPNLASLVVKEFDPGNRGHLAMAAVNPFSIWQLALLAFGTAKLAGTAFRPMFVVLLGVWIGYKGIAVILGLLQFAF